MCIVYVCVHTMKRIVKICIVLIFVVVICYAVHKTMYYTVYVLHVRTRVMYTHAHTWIL